MNSKGKIIVGLSGGVDSSVAAALLKEEGYDVTGVSMEIYDGSIELNVAGKHACYGPDEKEDIESAEGVCRNLGMPFHVVDLKKEFSRHVLEYFREEYLKGRTPNPCIVCNQRVKFGFLLEKLKEAGIEFDFFATGHYARIIGKDGRFLLKRAVDVLKDQSYFLYSLTQKQLSRTRFPLGDLKKNKVRKIAGSLGLKTSDRPESQDFISGGDYDPLFKEGEVEEGDIVNEYGKVLGQHKGIIHYTYGQRKGLGIAAPKPLYVSGIDAETNRIIVSERAALFSKGLIANNLSLIAIDKLERPYNGKAKIRLNHEAADATISPFEEHRAEIIFEKPQLSITPGQSVVFYQGDTIIGGGIIDKAFP